LIENRQQKILFFAPNIHTGGGLTLLKGILQQETEKTSFILDSRAKPFIHSLIKNKNIYWVSSGLQGRLKSEFLARKIENDHNIILCFHNIPCIFTHKKSIVYLQNRLLIDQSSLSCFKFRSRIRLIIERSLARILSSKVSEYIVQTETMSSLLKSWLNYANKIKKHKITIMPFASLSKLPEIRINNVIEKKYDFLYIADGQPHKNHKNLIKAWEILASNNVFPKLALTLTDRDQELKHLITKSKKTNNVIIDDLGTLTNKEIMQAYSSSMALIYPSKLESFGLPLVEASSLNIPIIASELSYVRDVCIPIETFDPNSPISIAHAVQRYLEKEIPTETILSAKDFWQQIDEKRAT